MENTEALSSVPVGGRGRVVGFDLPHDHRQRLLEMGLTLGTSFEVVRYAPLGDPMDLKVRGYHLSIRKQEANGIKVARL